MGSVHTHYEVLGVARQASNEQIKIAYRRLVMKYHPDRQPLQAAYHKRFQEVVAAYSVLSDAKQRALYDRTLPSKASRKRYTINEVIQGGMSEHDAGSTPHRQSTAVRYRKIGHQLVVEHDS